MNALQIAARGMAAQQRTVEVVSNNLANMNTTAYARRDAEFLDLIYTSMPRGNKRGSRANTQIPGGVQSGHGVRLASISRIQEQGSLKATSNVLDLAIEGRGFFEVRLPNGDTAFTRDGSFQLAPTGEVVTHNGYPLAPGIVIPSNATDISVNAGGEISIKVDGNEALQAIGQIQLVTFANPGGLDSIGGNLLKETRSSGTPTPGAPATAGVGAVMQGYLESSNVNPIQEIANMIAAQRAYSMNSKVVEAADQMMAIRR